MNWVWGWVIVGVCDVLFWGIWVVFVDLFCGKGDFGIFWNEC